MLYVNIVADVGPDVWTQERCTWVTTQHSTSPFVEEMYDRIKETLNEYDIIIHRWPEYTIPLEHVKPLICVELFSSKQ